MGLAAACLVAFPMGCWEIEHAMLRHAHVTFAMEWRAIAYIDGESARASAMLAIEAICGLRRHYGMTVSCKLNELSRLVIKSNPSSPADP